MTSWITAWMHIGVVAAGARVLGRWTIGRYWNFGQSSVQKAAETSIGLLLLSHFIFLLSSLHLLSTRVLFLLLVALGFIAAAGLFSFLRTSPQQTPSLPACKNGWIAAFAVFALLYGGWIVACAGLPPSDRDELIYHLEIPRQFLAHGGLFQFRDNIYGYFPQLGEMLFLFGIGTSGVIAAKCYHMLYGVLLAAELYGFSRASLDRKHSLLTVLIFLSVPVVIVTMPLAYVDLAFALYTFLALIGLLRFFETTQLRWAVLAGIFTGAAMATKYTGIQILILLICLLLLGHAFHRRKCWPHDAWILTLAALFVFFPYLWRNWSFTGWPLFPFATGPFSLNPAINWDPERARLYLAWLGTFGAPIGGQTLGHILFAPVLVFITAKFNDPQYYEGMLGPIFLLTPLFLVRAQGEKPKAVRWLGLFSVLFLFYWALTTRQSRFLIPILPVLSFLLVYSLASLKKKSLYALVAVLILFNFWAGVKETWGKDPFPFWRLKESREGYLERQWPGARIYREANQQLGPADRLYLINMKNYGYYLNVPFRADYIFERYNLDQALAHTFSADPLRHFLKHEGISHLLVNESSLLSPDLGLEPGPLAVFKDFLARHAEPLTRDRGFVLYRLANTGTVSTPEAEQPAGFSTKDFRLTLRGDPR